MRSLHVQCQKLDITFNSFIDLEDDEQQIITAICKRKQMNKAFLMELQTNWLSYFLNNSLRNQPNLGLSGPALPATMCPRRHVFNARRGLSSFSFFPRLYHNEFYILVANN